ncbi:MAG: thiopeptide-type bacteriocin biosynthesis protein [Ignavibacteria bacterium]|nr:thiopeptide-type bacteriocin biosynthesis protein [Ignavibacteria bacterium]
MINKKNPVWISLYVYYHPPYDELLKSIYSLILKLKKDKLLLKFFFIRYWEKGFHIRLRLLVYPMNRKEVLHDAKEHINSFLKSKPADYSTYPQNTDIQNKAISKKYIPELERYGGKKCIKLSESQFELSSSVVLKILRKYDRLSYQISFYNAIKYHIFLLKAFELSKNEAENLISYYTTIWSSSIIGKFEGCDSLENILNRFTLLYTTQKKTFKLMVKSINEEYENKDGITNAWIKGLKKIHAGLKKSCGKNHFFIGRKYIYDDTLKGEKKVYMLLPSYMHMMNNRLSIPNQDEAFISFIINQNLSQLFKK